MIRKGYSVLREKKSVVPSDKSNIVGHRGWVHHSQLMGYKGRRVEKTKEDLKCQSLL